jgi:uncharacterized protein (DUF427 family)
MGKPPGHRQWPEHVVRETPIQERMTVEIDGTLLADSRNVIRVDEDGSPVRCYFQGDSRSRPPCSC